MQTFLPYPDFNKSALVLDYRRLGKQRVENLQIMKALLFHHGRGWVHHPAVRMWKGYEWALLMFQDAICREWEQERGFVDTCYDKTSEMYFSRMDGTDEQFPPWLGDETFHRSHQSNLVRKKPEHYRQYFPDVPDDLPYIWPI